MTIQYKPKTGGRGIEWTDSTIGPIGGCMHDCRWQMPDGTTAICYADNVATNTQVRSAYPHGFKHHYFREAQLKDVSRGKDPMLIFINSMSDMFAPWVPETDVRLVLSAMRNAPHHSYQSLTKAAPQLLKYIDDLPPNLWVGVSSPPDWFMGKRLSLVQQRGMLAKSLDVLNKVKDRTGNIVWMSAEPVSWDFADLMADHPLDWIVIGAASSGQRYFQPEPTYIRNLLNAMDYSKTPVFYKGNIAPMFDSEAWDLAVDAFVTWSPVAAHDPLAHTARLNRWREDFPTNYCDGTPIPAVTRRQAQCEKHGWAKIALPMA